MFGAAVQTDMVGPRGLRYALRLEVYYTSL